MNEVVISTSDLMTTAGNFTLVVDSLEIFRGEHIGLLGANGAGKTTLLDVIAGFKKHQGNFQIAGVERINSSSLYKKLGYVFQNPSDQLFSATVEQDIRFSLDNFKIPHELSCMRIDLLCETLNLRHLLKKAPYELSYGEKKRVSIAAAIAHDPEIILFDEPFAGLDRRERKNLEVFLKSLNATMILTGHHPDDLSFLCGRSIILASGKLAYVGKTEGMTDQQHMLWGLA